jgi:hypothetical protein
MTVGVDAIVTLTGVGAEVALHPCASVVVTV